MEIDSLGPYSPDVVYGQLSSPFTPKAVTINSHTAYDKIEDRFVPKVFSRGHFKSKPQAKLNFELENDTNDKKDGLNAVQNQLKSPYEELVNNNLINNNVINNKENEFPPAAITAFQASSLSSKDIVQNSLKQGYTPAEAVHVNNARKAYEQSILGKENFAETLSTRSFKVN